MNRRASNQQRKCLNFFKVPFKDAITGQIAHKIIGGLMANPRNRRYWRRYKIATLDLSQDSPEVMDYDPDILHLSPTQEAIDNYKEAKKEFDRINYEKVKERVAELDQEFLDSDKSFSEAPITSQGKVFGFTGGFEYGTRAKCIELAESRGGSFSKANLELDFLVVGEKGSSNWKFGEWGNKLKKAVLAGIPVISESDWMESLK